jgi:hypothetical protein
VEENIRFGAQQKPMFLIIWDGAFSVAKSDGTPETTFDGVQTKI